MGKELTLEERFKQATNGNGNLKVIEETDQEIDGKKVSALKIERTNVKFYGRETLERELEKQGLHLCESQKSSPFMHVCDETKVRDG